MDSIQLVLSFPPYYASGDWHETSCWQGLLSCSQRVETRDSLPYFLKSSGQRNKWTRLKMLVLERSCDLSLDSFMTLIYTTGLKETTPSYERQSFTFIWIWHETLLSLKEHSITDVDHNRILIKPIFLWPWGWQAPRGHHALCTRCCLVPIQKLTRACLLFIIPYQNGVTNFIVWK